ncbi:hypothetical protein [Pararobbsia silviterrae]|uniref:Uncharacterized protein n=1 Tax=Pararobbsia silviterrae TaxID=1792498 RepID=A0A494XN92_9BURK|nr:hypothetical protein [Pararobbsia silviterrae]RKP49579.1 hypothetical protein D7S86_19970 [Pararobbsia silviterrae]
MPLLFFPLLGFIVFIIAAGWGFNALSRHLGSDIAIAIYFLVLALASAVPIAWLRRRKRVAGSTDAPVIVSRTFAGARSSVVVDARDRSVLLTLEGRTRRYAFADLREWSVFEHRIGAIGGPGVATGKNEAGQGASEEGAAERRTIEAAVTRRDIGEPAAGVAIRTRDIANAIWTIPLASIEQARECVALLDGIKAQG